MNYYLMWTYNFEEFAVESARFLTGQGAHQAAYLHRPRLVWVDCVIHFKVTDEIAVVG